METLTVRPRITPDENRFLHERRRFLSSRDEEVSIIIGCAHIPFQNRQAMDRLKKLAIDLNIDKLVWLGDAIDCNALGHFDRGMLSPGNATLEEEYDEANKELDEWDNVLRDDVKKIYMFGNHENRYFKWLKSPDNKKYGDMLSPVRGLKLDERHYRVVTDYRDGVHQIGDLEIFHGDLANIHVAKKSLDTYRKNTMFAHSHRIQVYREGDYVAYNIGTMSNLNAPCFDYAPRSMKEKWANGFGITINIDGVTHAQVIEIHDGHFYYGGFRY